jgi:hypothetical protein
MNRSTNWVVNLATKMLLSWNPSVGWFGSIEEALKPARSVPDMKLDNLCTVWAWICERREVIGSHFVSPLFQGLNLQDLYCDGWWLNDAADLTTIEAFYYSVWTLWDQQFGSKSLISHKKGLVH